MSLASLTDFLSANPQLGLVMIVGLGFIEACPGIGLFVSGVILFGVASFLFVEDLYSIVQIVPCAMLGGFLADQFGYWLGRETRSKSQRVHDDASSCQSIGSRRDIN